VGSQSEINLREEMNNFLDGLYPEIAKKQPAVLRRMRRTATGALIECACIDASTKEADKSSWCPFCSGESYIWDEILVDIYKKVARSDTGNAITTQAPSSVVNVPIVIFYLRSSVVLTEEDKIVELVLDEAGLPIRPYRRRAIYKIGQLIDFRSDNGKLEFWQVDGVAELSQFLNGPGA
jgi:hypothetical protein